MLDQLLKKDLRQVFVTSIVRFGDLEKQKTTNGFSFKHSTEFRSMALGVFELLLLKVILDDLKIKWKTPMKLYYNNKLAIGIAQNLVQHDRTKYFEVDKYFIKEKVDNGLVCTPMLPQKVT